MAKRFSILLSAVALLVVAGAGCRTTAPAFPRAVLENPNVVAVYADEVLMLDDFEREYAKSVGGPVAAADDSLGAYQDFLRRYVDYRLKVHEGRAAGYADDPGILGEINSYRASFAKPYLLDKEILNPIIAELYERSREMVDASHILLRVPPDAPPADTLAAYEKLTALRDSVLQGADFGELAMRHSEDPSAQRPEGQLGHRGRLGYFLAGRMVEEFEEMGYSTPIGEVSPVFRTRFGYHMLLVHDRREVVAPVRVSHIMLRPQGGTPEDSAAVRAELLELKRRIEAGEDFAQIAREHSFDTASAQNGGDLGTLRFDNYQVNKTFRDAVFAIDEVGTVSDVVLTPFGYHLIKITERDEFGTLDEEYEDLKATAAKLPRTKAAQDELAERVRDERGVMVDSTLIEMTLAGVPDDSLMHVLGGPMLPDSARARTIIALGDSSYSFEDVAVFLQNNSVPRSQYRDVMLSTVIDHFLNYAALNYEAAALEARDPEFAQIMQEFREGLILFRLMEDSVWTAAALDSAGVAAYFAAHPERYQFPERTRIIGLASPSDSVLTEALARLDGGLSLDALAAEIAQDSTSMLRLDTLRVEGQTNSVYDYALNLEVGAHTEPLRSQGRVSVLFNDGIEPPRAKTLDEARTEVVNDYQQTLEDRLLARLRAKYNARLFPERLVRAFDDVAAETTAATQ